MKGCTVAGHGAIGSSQSLGVVQGTKREEEDMLCRELESHTDHTLQGITCEQLYLLAADTSVLYAPPDGACPKCLIALSPM